MRVKLSLISAGMALAALATAGCGDDDNPATPAADTGAPSADGQTVNVSETDYKLNPSDPTVQPGTVSFEVTNDGGAAHNLEVEGPEGEEELKQDIGPGESDTLTVDLSKPGRYEFYCPVDGHRDLGMEGEITVTDGGAGEGGGGSSSAEGGGGGGGYGY